MASTRTRNLFAAFLAAMILQFDWAASASLAGDSDPNALFENRVRPVLTAHCVKCHGADKQESGLRLDAKGPASKGGDRGPAIVSGDPDHSLIVQAIRRSGELKMPPDESLRPEEVAGVVDWIRHGAPWPAEAAKSSIRDGSITDKDRQFWSFRPLAPTSPPKVRNSAWLQSPVDRFILARLEAESLKPAGLADKRTLIRRATFDLTGLPPRPADVAAFLADGSPLAFARVVDRLLASPGYGERWGRHWLDVVR
jgi:mono/diheme cytochrome c family protein